MKRKILSLAVVFAMMVSVFNLGAFSPSRAYAANTTLAALQSKFPNGKYWNSGNPDTYTSTPCSHHGYSGHSCSHSACTQDTGYCCYYGNCGCNSFGGAIQCYGFARKLGYDYYGTMPTTWEKVYNLNSLKAGDIIRYSGHSVWVTAVNGNTVTYADCNSDYKCKIRWNVQKSKSSFTNLKYVAVAPYAITSYTTVPSTPTITSISGKGSNVTVSWNGVANAEKYVVDFWNPNGSHNYYSTTATSLTQSLPDAQYGIRVCAENSIGQSVYTGFNYLWVSASTLPPTPTITDISVNGSNVTVSWSACDITNHYVVDFCIPDGAHNYYTTTATTMTKTLANGTYAIRVCAENTAGQSAYTNFNYRYVGEYPLTFDKNGGVMDDTYRTSKNIDAINSGRAADTIVAYTAGSTTGTNVYGYEVIVNSDGLVTDTNYYVGNSAIPSGGMVLSGHGDGCTWLDDNIEIGDYVTLDTSSKLICVYSSDAWKTVNKKVGYGEKYGFLPTPTRDGYDFGGWYTEGGTLITGESTVAENSSHTLIAKWTAKTPKTVSTVTKTGQNYTVNTVFSNLSDGKAFYAGYKLEKLYDVKIFDIASDKMPVTLSGDFDTIKVIVIDENFAPVTEGEILKP